MFCLDHIVVLFENVNYLNKIKKIVNLSFWKNVVVVTMVTHHLKTYLKLVYYSRFMFNFQNAEFSLTYTVLLWKNI